MVLGDWLNAAHWRSTQSCQSEPARTEVRGPCAGWPSPCVGWPYSHEVRPVNSVSPDRTICVRVERPDHTRIEGIDIAGHERRGLIVRALIDFADGAVTVTSLAGSAMVFALKLFLPDYGNRQAVDPLPNDRQYHRFEPRMAGDGFVVEFGASIVYVGGIAVHHVASANHVVG